MRLPQGYGETKYAAVVVGLLLVCVLWLASAVGLFTALDGVLYDYLTRVGMRSRGEPGVLLVEVHPAWGEKEGASWLSLLKEIQSLGAGQVLFTFIPKHATADFYASAHGAGNVFFGRRLIHPSGASAGTQELEPLPPAAHGYESLMVAHAIAPTEYGVLRRQYRAFPTQGNSTMVPALEAAAAMHVSENGGGYHGLGAYRVNFIGAYDLPRISGDRVLGGELIPELVKGRSVLVGFSDESPQLFTPLGGSGRLLSVLEFHGYALNTLLGSMPISDVPPLVKLPMLLAQMGSSLVVLQWFGMRYSGMVTAVLLLAHVLVAWVGLNFVSVWLPLAELWLTQVVIFLAFTRLRAVSGEEKLRRMVLDANAKLFERFFPPSFSASEEHWSQVISMVNQTLNLDRVMFLERVTGDHRVREVKSLNCAIHDIKEQRRDYERFPYSIAIAERRPVEVKNYLVGGEDGEVQYLVPLLFGGDVLGFWAFGAHADKLAALRNRDAVLLGFAEQIAGLLFHRQQWLEREAARSSQFSRYLSLQGGEQVAESLGKTLLALDRRLVGVEGYLNGLSTAAILYDLFGRVLIVNRRMVQILASAKLAVYKITVTDLVSVVAGVELDYARSLMQSVILDRKKVSLPARLADDGRSYVLSIAPLFPERENQAVRIGDPLPFDLEGVLCELLDVTVIKRLGGMKEDLVEQLTGEIRNDMESLLLVASILEDPQLPEKKRSRVLGMVRDKIDDLLEVTEKTSSLLCREVESANCYPVDCKKTLFAAIEAQQSMAAALGIRFELKIPDFIAMVFASPDGLQGMLEAVLAVLIKDSCHQGVIHVGLEEREGDVVYSFHNQGFGLPDERFQSYLRGDAALSSPEFMRLRQCVTNVEQCGGLLEGHSEIGVGTRFDLKFRGFL